MGKIMMGSKFLSLHYVEKMQPTHVLNSVFVLIFSGLAVILCLGIRKNVAMRLAVWIISAVYLYSFRVKAK